MVKNALFTIFSVSLKMKDWCAIGRKLNRSCLFSEDIFNMGLIIDAYKMDWKVPVVMERLLLRG